MNHIELVGAVMKEARVREVPLTGRTTYSLEFMLSSQYPAPNEGEQPWIWRHPVSMLTDNAEELKEKFKAGSIVYVGGSVSVRTYLNKENQPITKNEVKAALIDPTRFGSEYAILQEERGTYTCNQHILNQAIITGTLEEDLDHGPDDVPNHPTVASLAVPDRYARKPHTNLIKGKTWEENVIKQFHEAQRGDTLRIAGMLLDSYRKDEESGSEKFEVYVRIASGMQL